VHLLAATKPVRCEVASRQRLQAPQRQPARQVPCALPLPGRPQGAVGRRLGAEASAAQLVSRCCVQAGGIARICLPRQWTAAPPQPVSCARYGPQQERPQR
jgi:hypothetical protein